MLKIAQIFMAPPYMYFIVGHVFKVIMKTLDDMLNMLKVISKNSRMTSFTATGEMERGSKLESDKPFIWRRGYQKKALIYINLRFYDHFVISLLITWDKFLFKTTFCELVASNIKNMLYTECLNTELFLVRIFLYSFRTQENTDQK